MKAALATCVLLLAACGCRRAPAPPAEIVAADPGSIVAAVRQRDALIHSLRARFTARVQRGTEVQHADGVLLVKKPDRFRVRLLSAFGLTVFDYVSWQTHARMRLPLEGKQLDDEEIANQAAFSPADMRSVFLRGDDALSAQCTALNAGAEAVLDCRDPTGAPQRLVRIGAAAQTIRQEISFIAGQPHLIMQFDDYRRANGTELPFAIELTYPDRAVRLQIRVRNYEINPQLPDSLFEATEGSGTGS